MNEPRTAEAPTGIESARARLAVLGRRLRAGLLAGGVARWLGAAALLLVALFAADRLLDLPLGVRRFVRLGLLSRPEGMALVPWLLALGVSALLALGLTRGRRGAAGGFAFLAAGAPGLLAWVAWRALAPLRVHLGEGDLALAVERRHPELGDRLASALDFERELAHPTRGESVPLMRQAVGEAAARVSTLPLEKALSGRPLRRSLVLGAAGLALLGGTAALWSADFGLFLQRTVALEDTPWPRATTIVAVDLVGGDPGGEAPGGTRVTEHDPAVPYEVALGRPLTLTARAIGRVPDEVLLLDRSEGREPLPRRMFRVPGHDDLFAFELRDVRRPFEFLLRGGDDRDDDPVYRVEITVAPRLLAVRTHVEPPAYLGERAHLLDDGNVRVPEGSQLRITFQTDTPASEAIAWIDDQRIEAEPVEAPEGAAPGTVFTFPLKADATTAYRIAFRTSEGRRNDPATAAYRITVVPDRPPRVAWVWPRGVVETTARGRVPLLAEAQDDHGVARLQLEVRLGETTLVSAPLEPMGALPADDAAPTGSTAPFDARALDGPLGRANVRAYVALDLPRVLALVAAATDDAATGAGARPSLDQARMAVRLVATDARGQVREGEWNPIDVFGDAAIERGIAGRRSSVRAAFLAARRDQQARRDEISALLGGAIGDPERDELRSVRFRQGRIAQDVDRAAQDLIAVLNSYVFSRLGGEQPIDRILGLIDQHHRASFGRVPEGRPAEAGAAEGRAGAWAGDPVFPYALQERIVAGWRSREIYDRGVLDRMLAVLADAVEAAAREAPAVHRAAAAAADGTRASMEALAARQDVLLALLDRLEHAMGGWQSLSDLTENVRAATLEQEGFVRLLEELERARRAAGEPGAGGGPR